MDSSPNFVRPRDVTSDRKAIDDSINDTLEAYDAAQVERDRIDHIAQTIGDRASRTEVAVDMYEAWLSGEAADTPPL